MTNGRNSLRTRLLAVAKELKKRKDKGESFETLAHKVAKHHGFRRRITHNIIGRNTKGVISTDGWVVIYQMEREDNFEKEFIRSEPFSNEEQALEFLHQQWGEDLDPSLVNIMLQRVVLQPEFEAIGVEDAVNSVQNSMKNLVQHYENDQSLGFPEGYGSEDDFFVHVQQKQSTQLDNILMILNDKKSKGLIRKVKGKSTVLNERRWKDEYGTKDEDGNTHSYPFRNLTKVELRVATNQQIYILIAIEEYLFFSEGDPLLYALAKSHSVMHASYGADKVRPALGDDPTIGLWIGQDNLVQEIVRMTTTGFDFQPIFNDAKQCVGTIELVNVMMYLQNHEFGALPKVIDRDDLISIDLLSPAPPIVDARLPLHRVNEIMYYGIGCVLLRYDPELWSEEKQDFLNTHLKPGLHIFTKHDYVMSKTV